MVDGELLVEAGHGEYPADVSLIADEAEVAAESTDSVERADQDFEGEGVKEGNALQIHDQDVVPDADEREAGVPQAARGGQVQVSGESTTAPRRVEGRKGRAPSQPWPFGCGNAPATWLAYEGQGEVFEAAQHGEVASRREDS